MAARFTQYSSRTSRNVCHHRHHGADVHAIGSLRPSGSFEEVPVDITPNRRLLAIADDLSGAAEVAAALCSRTTRSRVVLMGRPEVVSGGGVSVLDPRHPGEATVLDLDSRYRPATEAAEAVRDALRLSSPDGEADGDTGRDTDGETLVLKKIDSLLRGNVAAEIAALAEGGAGVVLAPALPIAGRVVRSGVVHIGGVALHEGDAWRAETVPPPASVAQALGGLPTALIPLTTVRASPPALPAALRAAVAAGRVAICDAETDADLDAVVKASLAEGPRIRLVGSGGLAVALGRHLTTAPPATTTPAATEATAASATPAATQATAALATPAATAPVASAETGSTAPDPTGAPPLTVSAATTATTAPSPDTATAPPSGPAATGPATTKPTTAPAVTDLTGAPATTDPTGAPAADTVSPTAATPATTSPADSGPITAPGAANASPAPATPATTSPADNAPITAPGAANAPAITTPAGTTASTAGTTVPSANAGAAPTTTAAPGADTATSTPSGPATTPAWAPSAGTGRPVLVVVGTAEPAAAEQIRRLVEDGATHHQLPLAGLLSDGPPPRLPPLTAPVTVVSLAASPSSSPVTPGPAPTTDRAAPIPSPRAEHTAVAPADVPGPPPSPAPGSRPATPPPPGGGADRTGPGGSPSAGPADDAGARPGPVSVSGRRLVFGLARVIRDAVAAHHGAVDLVLTGGETARRVLDALAVAELDPVGQVHHGAVHLSTPDGRSVVTRPGSFGDPDSLRHIVQALRPHPMERKVTS
ncbi:four-carbon acid sugar kinase family protein [Streptomyces sp. NPDC127074]|uniref:four-carbon acid sugar kinase family protein n=1 Tax=Streptomyces sp. NPDC127074 TaxID=3347130 RepID=UPI00365BC7BB